MILIMMSQSMHQARDCMKGLIWGTACYRQIWEGVYDCGL